jgi:hypothetical protein
MVSIRKRKNKRKGVLKVVYEGGGIREQEEPQLRKEPSHREGGRKIC